MSRAMRVATVTAAAVLLLTPNHALAATQPSHLSGRPLLEVASGQAVRVQPTMSARVPLGRVKVWNAFMQDVGATWRAMWDSGTGVPSRLFGKGISTPGAMKSPQVAAQYAIALLNTHIELLAPGNKPTQFVMVSNVLGGGMRSIGFFQFHNGMRVLGGQVSFRFKNDRLFMIGSEAMPKVRARTIPASVSPLKARGAAVSWILDDSAASAIDTDLDGPFVLPLIGNTGVTYRTVMRVTVAAEKPIGQWSVYVDAYTGELVAREQTLRFASGTVRYNVPVRWPGAERQDMLARATSHQIGGATAQSDEQGVVTWAGDAPVSITMRVIGSEVSVKNETGAAAENTVSLAPGGEAIWNSSDDERLDSQLTTFIHTRIARDYVRDLSGGDFDFLRSAQVVNVNIDDSCNAFADGSTINFFMSSADCGNTGRLPDVIYHEYGHVMHAQTLIQGVGAFDGAFSEGLSDYLSATINDDPGMGRGFFHSSSPLRDLDPDNREHKWPDDIGAIHFTGLIFGGAMWDLRKALVAEYGKGAGVALSDQLFFAAVQRATNIPTTYLEVLAADDDNGDLSDGTPNKCMINAVFGVHGLRTVDLDLTPLSVEVPTQEGHRISLQVAGDSTCPGDAVTGASLEWQIRGEPDSGGSLVLSENAGKYETDIPTQAAGTTVRYQIKVEFADGASTMFPNNAGDPWYEFFVGEVVVLYCTDFEDGDPFASGWTHGLTSGDGRDGADDWAWGTPAGTQGSGDPSTANSGDNVIGNDLGGGTYNGLYQPNKINFAMSPVVDTENYSDVRLQYWRWLNVEDAFFDKGTIHANGELAWINFNSDNGDSSSTHHADREWRFHDVPLSSHIKDGSVQVKFQIETDGGLELGGWNIDDFCIVAVTGAVCGDGVKTSSEECDDGAGNSDTTPGACRENCRAARCGDGVVDEAETCDDGNTDPTDECNNSCERGAGFDGGGGDCGCASGPLRSDTGLGGLLLIGLCGFFLFRRRRSRVCSAA